MNVFCKAHPSKKVGQDQFGNYYSQCYEGWKEKERGEKVTCELIFEACCTKCGDTVKGDTDGLCGNCV